MHCVLKNNRSLEWRPWHCHRWSNFLAGLPFDFWKIANFANFANFANLANHNSLKSYHYSLDDSSELPHHVAPGVLHVVRIGCRFRLKYLYTFNYKFCLRFLTFQFHYFHSYKNCVNSLWRQAPPDASHVLRSFLRLKSLLCLIPLPASRQANFDHKRKFFVVLEDSLPCLNKNKLWVSKRQETWLSKVQILDFTVVFISIYSQNHPSHDLRFNSTLKGSGLRLSYIW